LPILPPAFGFASLGGSFALWAKTPQPLRVVAPAAGVNFS